MTNIMQQDYVINKLIKYLYEYGTNKYITAQMQHKLLLNFAVCCKSAYMYVDIFDFALLKDHIVENKIIINKYDSKHKYKLTDKNLSNIQYIETTCNKHKYTLYLYNLVQIKNIAYNKHVLELETYKSKQIKQNIRRNELLKKLTLNKINVKHINFPLCQDYIINNNITIYEIINILLYLITNSNYDFHMNIDKSIEEISNNIAMSSIPKFIKEKVIEYNNTKERKNIIRNKFNDHGIVLLSEYDINNYIQNNVGNVNELVIK